MPSFTNNDLITRRLKRVQKQVLAAANTTDTDFYMLIDLSNASGLWPHRVPRTGQGVQIYQIRSQLAYPTAADLYRIDFGVIVRADATNADVSLITLAGGVENYFPIPLNLRVAAGKMSKAYGTVTAVNTTKIQTNVALIGPSGNSVLPAVGDVVFRVISTKTAPAGAITVADVGVQYDVG